MTGPSYDVTQSLQDFADGNPGALGDVVSQVYPDLHEIAERQLRRMRFGETLNATGLVHETFLKLVDQSQGRFHDRRHFFAISAHAMRQIIVDHARKRSAQKRGGGEAPQSLDEARSAVAEEAQRILELNEALEQLGRIDENLQKVVECRYFAGYSEPETAEALGVSVTTVQRLWRRARIWLKSELAG